jgi:uncharacterized protein (TIGR02147 family)
MIKNLKILKISILLKDAFQKLKVHDGLTLRQWAQMTALSPSYLNLVLSSKRLPPKKTLLKLAKSLDLDSLSTEALLAAHTQDWLAQKKIVYQKIDAVDELVNEFDTVIAGESILLKSWLHLAILEFSTCHNFTDDPTYLSKIFNTSNSNIKVALYDLLQSGFLIRNRENKLEKSKLKLRIPTTRSREVIRNFHIENLKKAVGHLQTNYDQKSFEKRLITGYTLAVNPEYIDQAKIMIQKSLVEIVAKLTSGSCSEVYQLQIQLFPLSGNSK